MRGRCPSHAPWECFWTMKGSVVADVKRINLALQGGGAHGAFTWGVLDRLLDDERIEIAGMSGTSAGALNGAAFKAGWLMDGRDGARAEPGLALGAAWARCRTCACPRGCRGFCRRRVWSAMQWSYSWPFAVTDTMSRGWCRLTPMGRFISNPLRRIVDQFQYDKVCADQGPAVLRLCDKCA